MSSKNHAIEHILDDPLVVREIIAGCLGEIIGEGSSRYVFDDPFNKGLVIKIDVSTFSANFNEWIVWDEVKNTPALAKWFAPVIRMSRGGRVLYMKKARLGRFGDGYPKKIPDFFTDIKPSNFGWIGKQFVCVDYGIVDMLKLRADYALKPVTYTGW